MSVQAINRIDNLVSFLQNWPAISAGGLILEAPPAQYFDLDNPEEMFALGERLYAATCPASNTVNLF